MKKLFQLEFIKTYNNPAFRAIILLHAILFLIVVIIGSQFEINIQGIQVRKLFVFPHVWGTFAWIGSWFNLLLGILIAILVGNEHQFKTFRKQVVEGLPRTDLLNAKLIIIGCVALYAFLLIFFSGLVFGLITTNDPWSSDIFGNIYLVLILFIQAFAYMMLGMVFTIALRNNALAIVLFILFFALIEPIFRAFFPSSIDKFFPVKIISNLTPVPDFFGIAAGDLIQIKSSSPTDLYSMGILPEHLELGPSIIMSIAYIILFYFICRLLLKRMDL